VKASASRSATGRMYLVVDVCRCLAMSVERNTSHTRDVFLATFIQCACEMQFIISCYTRHYADILVLLLLGNFHSGMLDVSLVHSWSDIDPVLSAQDFILVHNSAPFPPPPFPVFWKEKYHQTTSIVPLPLLHFLPEYLFFIFILFHSCNNKKEFPKISYTFKGVTI
jgi:hypothetical protein